MPVPRWDLDSHQHDMLRLCYLSMRWISKLGSLSSDPVVMGLFPLIRSSSEARDLSLRHYHEVLAQGPLARCGGDNIPHCPPLLLHDTDVYFTFGQDTASPSTRKRRSPAQPESTAPDDEIVFVLISGFIYRRHGLSASVIHHRHLQHFQYDNQKRPQTGCH